MPVIVDSAVLGKVRPAPGGGIIIPARIGRAGVQTYRRPDGSTVRAYRPAEEVFAADFTGAPITIGHPEGGVSPGTWLQHARGNVRSQEREPVVVDGKQWAQADLQVSASDALNGVATRTLTECSCAYDCTRDWTPGVTEDGEPYDVIFKNLKPNHVALGGNGFARAGRDAKVLISDGETMNDVLSDSFFAADSADPVPAAAQPAAQDVAALAKLVNDSTSALTAVTAERDALTAQLAAATQQVAKLTADAASIPAQIADGVKAELAFRTKMLPLMPKDFSFDGKSQRDVRVAAVTKLDPKFVVSDSVTDTYLDAYIDAASKYATPHDHNTDLPVTDAADTTAGACKDPAKHISNSTKDLWKGTK